MRVCPQCGVETPNQAKFCGNCGYVLSTVSPPQANSPVSFSPSNPPPFVPSGINQGGISSPSPYIIRRTPLQPDTLYTTVPELVLPGRRNRRRLVFVWLGIAMLIILAIAGLLVFLSSNRQPRLSILQGQPRPGQQFTLLGEHFPSGSKMSLVVDTQPLLLSLTGANLHADLIPLSFSEQQGIIYRAVVASDGTFTVKIRVPTLWKSGSKFIVIAQITDANPQQVKPVEYQITIV